MIEFFHYWSALFGPPLIGWTICAQLLAAVTIVTAHFVAWKVRRYALICVPLGALSWLALSLVIFIFGWILGGWDDDSIPPPPDFVDLTWLYFAGLETGFILLALGAAFLHRKQFALPLLRGFCGFFFDAMLNIVTFTYLILYHNMRNLGDPFENRTVLFYI